MKKEECIEILKNNGYEIKMENSVIFVILEDYSNEKIHEVSALIKDYKGSLGFRPKKIEEESSKA